MAQEDEIARPPNLAVVDEELLDRLPLALERASQVSVHAMVSMRALAKEPGRSELKLSTAYNKYPRTLSAIRRALGEPEWPIRVDERR